MITPVRVQLSRAKGWRMPPNTVKVDRTTGFGNPFPISKATMTSAQGVSSIFQIGTWNGPAMWVRPTREEAATISVDAFKAWIKSPGQQSLVDRAQYFLRGKNLACWCALDAPCHAGVLLEIANRPVCEAVA